MRTIAVVSLVAVLSMAALAQENPVVLYEGLGNWRHPIHTSNPEAQKFFDQGLALLYGFNQYEALRSFRKAAELDPQAAMAYWGMAMAQGPYINMDMDSSYSLKGSCQSVDAGLKLTGVPEHEQDYLRAAAKRCPILQSQAYTDAMHDLATRWPDDADALAFYADSLMVPVRWHWYGSDGTPAKGMVEAEHALEQLLRRWPDHPGANHYYIHAVESSRTPERAIPCADRLPGLMPGAGHMVHMSAHIWLLVGDFEKAAAVNERAATDDRDYFDKSHVLTSGYHPYYLHNLKFITYARAMQGNRAAAVRAADDLSAAVEHMATSMPMVVDAFEPAAIFSRVRVADWEGIRGLPPPGAGLTRTTAVWRFARALALSSPQEQAEFEALRAKLPASAHWGNNKAADVLAVASEIIAARLAQTPAEAVPHWQQAVAHQDALAYDEPPDWYYPLRESLGAALLRAGKAADAEGVFREGVRRSPRNGRMLFGLMESLRAQGKTEDAAWVQREFESAWAWADIKLKLDEL